MKTLSDLNNYLFAELDRLNKVSTMGTDIEVEVERAKAVAMVASQVISNAHTAIKAQTITQSANMPKFLEYNINGQAEIQ